MTRIILFSFSLLLCYITNGQITRGSILLGGSAGLSNSKTPGQPNDYSNNYFSIYPSLGFALTNNRVLGFHLSYNYGVQKSNSTKTAEANGYGSGIFLRRYMHLGKGFLLFGQGGANFFYSKNEQKTSPLQVQKGSNFSLNVFPGIAYVISTNFHLEGSINNLVSIGYASTKYEDHSQPGSVISSKSSQTYFNVNTNPTTDLSIGFRIIL